MTDRRLTKQRRVAANVLPMKAWLEPVEQTGSPYSASLRWTMAS